MSGKASVRIGTGLLALAILAGCLTFLSQDAGAASFSLFVRRTQVESSVQGNKVYAPASALLKAMGYEWTAVGDGYDVKAGTAGGPEIKSRRFVVNFQGKTFTPDSIYHNGRVWVLVEPFVKNFGALYVGTPDMGMAQVVFPSGQVTERDIARAVKEAQRRPTAETKPADPKKGGPVADAKPGDKPTASPDKPGDSGSKDEEKEPLEAKVVYSNPAIPGGKYPAQVLGTVTVKNTSDQPVKNVRYTVTFNNQGGEAVQTLPTESVAEIGAGQSVQKDFQWWNYAQVMNLDPKVKLEHDPLPKKKKDEKKDEGKAAPSPAPAPDPGKK